MSLNDVEDRDRVSACQKLLHDMSAYETASANDQIYIPTSHPGEAVQGGGGRGGRRAMSCRMILGNAKE
jgi:hypothetical protein